MCVRRYWDENVARLFDDRLHGVSVVDQSEQVVATHGGVPGSGRGSVSYPIHLATVRRRRGGGRAAVCCVLVADSDNDRVKLLGVASAGRTAAAAAADDVLAAGHGLCGPYRLSVDRAQTLLAVGCVDGRVFVYRIGDLLPDAVVEMSSPSE